MSRNWKRLEHGMYLDSKSVMDNALPTLRQSLRDLVPSKLQGDLEEILDYFEHELVAADVSDRISDADLS